MNKIVFAVAAVVTLAASAFAEARLTPATMSPEQLTKLRELRQRQTGGFLTIAGQGHLAILNAQKTVSEETLAANVDMFHKSVPDVEVKILPATFTIVTAQAEVKKSGAGAAVFIVDDATAPVSLIAMEEGWGMINVAKLGGEGVDAKKFETRFRKEFVRVTTVVFTGPQSQYMTSPLQTVRSVEALDKVVGEAYGIDASIAVMNNLPKIGIKPSRRASYRAACQEGIAPQPTNDIQKAIWDEVHALPSRPLRLTK